MANSEKVDFLKRVKHFTSRFVNNIFHEDPPGLAYADGVDAPSIAATRSVVERAGLSGLLNYESYDEENKLYYNNDSISFCLISNPAAGLSESDLRVLNGLFSQNHKPGTTMQISLVADNNIDYLLNYWRGARNSNSSDPNAGIFEALADRRVNYLRQGRWKSIFSGQHYLFRNYHLIFSYNVPVPEGLSPYEVKKGEIEEIMRVRQACIGVARSANIHMRDMEPEEFINLLYPILNPSDEKLPYFNYDENQVISQQMVDGETLFLSGRDGSSLVRGDKQVSVLPWSVRQYPQQWSGGANGQLIGNDMDDILRMPCPFIYTQNIYIPDQISKGGAAKRNAIRATQMTDSPIAKFVPQWKERKADWDYVTTKMADGSKMIESFFQIVLFASPGEEDQCEQALKGIFGSNGWTLQKDRFIPLHGFLSALPMWTGRNNTSELLKLKRYRSMLSWNVINTSPLIAEYKGTGTPSMMMAGRRGQMAFMDNFDNREGNFNIAVAAASGAGKSFITSEFCYTQLSAGGRGFIIDSGRSYERLCGLLNGAYLNFDSANEINVNPFTHMLDMDEGMPLIMMLIQEMAGVDSKDAVRKAMIERAVNKAWEARGNDCTFSDVRAQLEGKEDPRENDIATALFPYCKGGRFARYFEGPSTINFDTSLVVLELDDLNSRPELQSIVLLILMFNITQSFYMGDRKQRKFCIIDEAWRLLSRGTGAAGEFIEEGYRVARKYGGCFMTITQRIGDYYKSDVAKAAYSNSDWTWLLRQKTEDLVECKENGWLNCGQGRLELFDSLKTDQGKYSEIAMISPSGIGTFRFIVDPFTEKLYSTKASEYQYIAERIKAGHTIVEAIEELVKQTEGER